MADSLHLIVYPVIQFWKGREGVMGNKEIDSTKGLVQVTLAHVIWGMLPLYWSLLNHVSSFEVMMNRMLWTALFCALYFLVRGRNPLRIAQDIFRTRNVWLLFISAVLISVNWVAFLYTVASGHVLQASMAYFISPLLLVLFAFIFFRERMSLIQSAALLLCLSGVVYTTILSGVIPYFSLLIATTFAAYTICKKALHLDGIQALLMDGLIILPLSLSYILYLSVSGNGSYSLSDPKTTLLLVFSGIVTLIPLALYISGNMSVSAMSVGFLQYILPTMAFLLGVFVFREPFMAHDVITFSLIIAGVAIYLVSLRKKAAVQTNPS